MDTQALCDLEELALKAALKSGTIEDIEKATSIAKQASEIRKVLSDSSNQPKLVRYEEFKAWAALLVPFLSIATLALTVYIQAAQLKATREANQDTQWRETQKNVLSQLSRPSTVIADPSMAMSILEPYLSDDRFGRDAKLLAINLLSSVPSSDRFKDFFLSHHIGEASSDAHLLETLGRDLYNNLVELDERISEANHAPILDAARNAMIDDIEFVTEKLCVLFHTDAALVRNLDLRDIFLLNGDLSGLDVLDADLPGANLQNVNVEKTRLIGTVKFTKAHFVDTHWWDAREISKPLLQFLMTNQYPFFDNNKVSYTVPPPDRLRYVTGVLRLCKQAGLVCRSDEIKYGTPPDQNAIQIKDAAPARK